MTDDPKRWREGDDGELASFVAALASATPTDALKERVWSKIAPTLPPGSGGGGGAAGASGAVKLAGFAVLAIASAALVWSLTKSKEPAAPTSAPIAVTTTSAPAPGPSANEEPAPLPPASVSAQPAASIIPTKHVPSAKPLPSMSAPPAPSLAPADRLREEAEGVRRARQLLREKNASGALAELDRLDKLTPNGPLAEEREVLTIEALVASGRADVARRRADRFLEERPQSVHASRIKTLFGR